VREHPLESLQHHALVASNDMHVFAYQRTLLPVLLMHCLFAIVAVFEFVHSW